MRKTGRLYPPLLQALKGGLMLVPIKMKSVIDNGQIVRVFEYAEATEKEISIAMAEVLKPISNN
jgi:hypothetical protein